MEVKLKLCKLIYRYIKRRLFSCNSVSLEVTLALILFGFAYFMSNPIVLVINMLYFIIVLEVTRMIVEYVRSTDHRVKIRYLVDAAIIAVLREIIIITVDHEQLYNHLVELGIYGIMIFVILLIRKIVMKSSPDTLEEKFCDVRSINK